ncbi:MAG: DUF4340 domain-containing protein [Gemmataceae bacterium]
MKFKQTALLIGFVLVVLAGMIIYSMSQPEDLPIGDAIFPGLAGTNVAEIDTLEYVVTQPQELKLVFSRTGEQKLWKVTSPQPAHVDSRLVDLLVESILKLKPIRFAELKSDPKAHELDSPTVRITIREGSSKTATLNIGSTTIGGDKAVTFVSTSANPGLPLAVRKLDLAPLFKDATKGEGSAWTNVKSLSDFRPRRLLGFFSRDILGEATAVRILSGKKELSLKSITGSPNWQFVVPETYGEADAGGDTEVNTNVFTGVRPLVNYLTTIQAQSSADFIESPSAEQIAKFGLKSDDVAVLRIELTTASGTERLYVGKVVEGDEKPVKRYARLDGDSCIVKVPFDRFDAILRTVNDPNEMRNRDILMSTIRDRIDAIDVSMGPNVVHLRRFGPKDKASWFLVGGSGDPKEANANAIDLLLQALTRPRAAVGFPAASDPNAFAPAETKAVISLWQDAMGQTAIPIRGTNTPEPPLTGDPIVLTFGKKDGDAILLKKTVKTRSTEMKVAEQFLPFATLNRVHFVSPGVQPFATSAVAKATFFRPEGIVEIVKSTGPPDANYPNGKWTFAQPPAQKDKIADQPKINDVLGLLGNLRAFKVISETPTEADNKTYGLVPSPRLKINVELSTEPGKIRTVEFGAVTPDGGFVYARTGASSLVFTVPKVDMDRMLTEDLRDAVLYELDRSKLSGFTVRGWSSLIPVPPTYEYIKTGPDWSCKAPAGSTADPSRIATFLSHVEKPRALRFIGPIKPEYKLDPANGGIEISFKQDGGVPIVLTLGAETDDGLNYFAKTSAMPNEAVVISASVIRLFVGTPKGLLTVPKTNPTPGPQTSPATPPGK